MSQYIPGNTPLVFPPGTTVEHSATTWAMYVNKYMNVTWIGYAMPGGTQLVKLPGIRTNLTRDFSGIKSFVKQRQATTCGGCGD